MSVKRFGHGRKFLNQGHGLAATEWSVRGEVYQTGTRKKRVNVDADFTVSDCNRQVTLDFGIWDKKDLKTRLRKVRDLQAELDKFAVALEDAIVWAEGQWPQ